MWLINTTTLTLKFFLKPPPRYAILSHVWTDEECSFQEFRSLETSSNDPALALNQMFDWVWIDTCCIDKTSSAELSESINSMFACVDFYNRSWKKIGGKWLLRKEISEITGIGEADLAFFDRGRSSIAQKLSWAPTRQTTRVEDEAYCLLGILGVYLPLLYGEGENAFRRLQEELIRTSTDQTIFAWPMYLWVPLQSPA
ncbi:hypothetical protein B0T14DRAFT_540758 [Immersiella caudata]|uniref:DUF8212 domain-containing protein n=1 Tax=Immersiella caudata TaxID=314043 RepID=A0AA39U3K5_9PEZI|nr:hypothetical protein B0T14DRAFT_540758 [Immersiella caudata]